MDTSKNSGKKSKRAVKNPRIQVPVEESEKEDIKNWGDYNGHSTLGSAVKVMVKMVLDQDADPKTASLYKIVLERKFSIPSGYGVRGFLSTLTKLATTYPRQSSKLFWKEDVYLSEIDKTHAEILKEISDDIRIEANKRHS